MARKHAILFTLALGLAAVIGTLALGRTLGVGTSSGRASDALVAKRTKQLDAYAASLRRQLAAKPAAIPTARIPARAKVRPERVVYVRPKPIVITKHRSGESEHEAEGGEHEGGFDD
jgi:hypothetical protein